MTTRDDELLDVLGASLGPPPDAEPNWAEISQLHRVIDTGWSGRPRSRTPVWRIRRPLTAAMAGFLVLGGASAAAAASGAVMPQPMRVAARAVGLPVESPDLADARAALARLRGALAAKPPDLKTIRDRAQDVRGRIARLSADDRSRVEDEAGFLLAAADAALAPPPVPLGSPPASTTTPPATPAAPAAPTAAPTADDHGGHSAEPDHTATGSGDQPSGEDHSGSSGPGPSASTDHGGNSGSSGDSHMATTQQVDNSGSGSSGSGSSDGGSSHDGGGSSSDGGGGSSDGGGGHSGPG